LFGLEIISGRWSKQHFQVNRISFDSCVAGRRFASKYTIAGVELADRVPLVICKSGSNSCAVFAYGSPAAFYSCIRCQGSYESQMMGKFCRATSFCIAIMVPFFAGDCSLVIGQVEHSYRDRKGDDSDTNKILESLFSSKSEPNFQFIDSGRVVRKFHLEFAPRPLRLGNILCNLDFLQLTGKQSDRLKRIDRDYKKKFEEDFVKILANNNDTQKEHSPNQIRSAFFDRIVKYLGEIESVLVKHQKQELTSAVRRYEFLKSGIMQALQSQSIEPKIRDQIRKKFRSLLQRHAGQVVQAKEEYVSEMLEVLTESQRSRVESFYGSSISTQMSSLIEVLSAQTDSSFQPSGTRTGFESLDFQSIFGENQQNISRFRRFVESECGWKCSLTGRLENGDVPVSILSELFFQLMKSPDYEAPDLFSKNLNDHKSLQAKRKVLLARSRQLMRRFQSGNLEAKKFIDEAQAIGAEYELFRISLMTEALPPDVQQNIFQAVARRQLTTRGLFDCLVKSDFATELKVSTQQLRQLRQTRKKHHRRFSRMATMVELNIWEIMNDAELNPISVTWIKRELSQGGIAPAPTFLLWPEDKSALIVPEAKYRREK
jgi:hypothetical protein